MKVEIKKKGIGLHKKFKEIKMQYWNKYLQWKEKKEVKC